MSPYHTCRLFAIYLAVTLIISESPVSGFTIQQTRTTTLKPFLDLTAEGSALLEIRYDLPKTNNVKESIVKDSSNINIGTHFPIRSFANVLESDSKSTLNIYNAETSTVELPIKHEILKTQKNVETTTDSRKPVTLNGLENSNTSEVLPVSEDNKFHEGRPLSRTEIKIAGEQKTTPSQIFTTKVIAGETLGNFENQGFIKSLTDHNESTLSQSDIAEMDTQSATNTNDQTETMTGDASSSPSWKTYTTIERKRTTVIPEISITKEPNEALAKSETVTSKITVEPQPVRDNVENSSLEQTYYNSSPPEEEQLPFTLSTYADRTTSNIPGYLSSKRAGFLDLTAKQIVPEKTTTEYLDGVTFNETELMGTMFDTDEGLESKKSSGVEAQSQMAEDAIKEELLEEEVLNDNFGKPFPVHKNSIRTTETNEPAMEDTLSVKPISSKGNLYTVSPHYKPMKKIEVQPLKPFIRDPDDNSWRNESLSLLGIVFKAKNASKPFTQVLKNKTEAELSNINEKDDKNEVTDLRERLEKIAEVRKSRKNKINKLGDTVYNDYEESTSSEVITTQKPETGSIPLFDANGKLAFISPVIATTSSSVEPSETTTPGVYMYKEETTKTTKKPKKVNKFLEYYDTTDEYDADYLTLPKLDLKKFTTHFQSTVTQTTPSTPLTSYTKPQKNSYLPERKPTIQYFPPLPQTKKVSVSDYDSDFQKKVNSFLYTDPPKEESPITQGTTPTTPYRTRPQHHSGTSTDNSHRNKASNLDKNHYVTYPSQVVEYGNRYPTNNDETFNRASYVIKHYKDLIDQAVKDDYDRSGEFVPSFTESPISGVTSNEGKFKTSMDDDYDYVAGFRKDILNRFVDNFNQNSERFKVDFPILYNNSVVHSKANDNGRVVASSSAFLKRLYESPLAPVPPSAQQYAKPCEPHCDIKVDLSPDYELHYYVPDQEEKEELEPKPATLPYTYRL